MNRYIMSYSQADGCNLIVYADSYEEAQMKFENGEYTLEDEESKVFDTMPKVSVPGFVPDEDVSDYLSDIYGYCVNSWYEIN